MCVPPLCTSVRVLSPFPSSTHTNSYVYVDGQLQPVPASRADLFADRSLLSLADKRSLGRFMAACVEAAEGSGRLKVGWCCSVGAVVWCVWGKGLEGGRSGA